MPPAKEKLPKGFTRRASGSLRVQIRVDGFSEMRNFPLMADTPSDRRRQLAEAEAWATETRRRIVGGSHVPTHEAERTTLATALERYARQGLKGDPSNAKKDRHRIKLLLQDPIARKTLAQLRKTDVAALRDRLLEAGFLRRADRVADRLNKEVASSERVSEIRSLRELVRTAKQAPSHEKPLIEARIAAIAAREGLKNPARTTIANIVQLVSRALKFAAQSIEGVPDLAGVQMPPTSAGRDRRVTDEELANLAAAAGADRLMPLIVQFGIATTLRRERLLSCRTSNIRSIGSGRWAISFPKDSATRKKRTGTIPVTRQIELIIQNALALQGYASLESAPDVSLFQISIEAFESRWRRLLAAANIKDLHFHDFRHEGTSRLFESGLTTAEVMSITGHSTKEMVDRYSHYSAGLVLGKLERGADLSALQAEISFLIQQFIAGGGEVSKLENLLHGN